MDYISFILHEKGRLKEEKRTWRKIDTCKGGCKSMDDIG